VSSKKQEDTVFFKPGLPLFTHPASKAEPLTDEEIIDAFEKHASLNAIHTNNGQTVFNTLVGVSEGIEFARSIEAAVWEKINAK
jgi:hypothetical protein